MIVAAFYVLWQIGLWILQVPLVLAHAVLAGLLNFIPNIGPTLSVVLPMSIALLDAPWKAIAVLILYIAIQNLESYWLTPTVMAKQVALLPPSHPAHTNRPMSCRIKEVVLLSLLATIFMALLVSLAEEREPVPGSVVRLEPIPHKCLPQLPTALA